MPAPTAAEPTFAELFTPKLVTVLREGYGLRQLKADAVAGLTVAIVALPLSMAIAIASGLTPDRGLYAAIGGGFLVSALGGSRFQIGGPAGAFIVLVAAAVEQHGVDGVILATAMSGLMLLAIGFLRLGTFIKYIPYPVTVGFTAGIAVIIFASQIKELLGLPLPREPGQLLPKLGAIVEALPTLNPWAVAVAALALGLIQALRRWRPRWPAFIIAVGLAAAATAVLGLPVETIGTRFGGIPSSLPAPHLPAISVERLAELLPTALSFALLGGIESLLSAVVADSMSGRRHRSNCELVAQGAANIGSALFGGFCVTGTIARTATNVRSGARGPVAGMLHSVFLLLSMLVAAPLAAFVPLAALASVLAVVAWNMVEKDAFATLLRASRGDAVVLLATFLLVMFRDLTEGILVGFGLGALLFLHRMSQAVEVEHAQAVVEADQADAAGRADRGAYDPAVATDREVVVYRISGAFFFGTAAAVSAVLDRLAVHPRAYVIDVSAVPVLDSTAAMTIEGFVRKAHRAGAVVYIAGAQPPIRRVLLFHGVRPPRVRFRSGLAEAVAAARARAAGNGQADDPSEMAAAP
jgi:sulfate permease, SulP family